MRLSEHERRVLAELEENLMASDPRFVRRFGQRPDLGPGSTPRLPQPRLPEYGRVRRAFSVHIHWWA